MTILNKRNKSFTLYELIVPEQTRSVLIFKFLQTLMKELAKWFLPKREFVIISIILRQAKQVDASDTPFFKAL